MTAPAIEAPAQPDAQTQDGVPEGAVPITLPVMAIEGMDTADGRHLEVGGITHRALPLSLLAQTKTPDGGDGHDNAWIVGAVTDMQRRPGPEVISRSTGQPFPEGTFVWSGRGWMYTDVPAENPAYRLVRDRALSGNSVDLTDLDGALEYADGVDPEDPDAQPSRVTMSGVISATTLVAQPAFPDAYVELDGELLVPDGGQVITASAVSWRSAELGDDCAPCGAGLAVETTPVEDRDEVDDAPPPVKEQSGHTGGMVALIPADPGVLAVEGGDPAEEMHVTLAYLGDDVTAWPEEQKRAVHDAAREIAAGSEPVEPDEDDPEFADLPTGPARGALEARVFAHSVFNPDGGPDGDKDPASVYLFGDEGAESLHTLHTQAVEILRDRLGDDVLPQQHRPFVPHATAGYNLPLDRLSFTGPVRFDRLRVALGGDVTDYPLGGGEPLVASAARLDSAVFAVVEADAPTPLTIGDPWDDGTIPVFGHIAVWNTCHIGFAGRCVTPPRSPSGYAYFHTGAVATDLGDVPVGQLTLGTAGHADLRANATLAAEHYDRTGTAWADVRAVDGRHGIWVSGRVRPGITDEQLAAARASAPSGDWRMIRGALEMVASLQVNVPGFPTPRARVASGVPVALVAGGGPKIPEPRPPSRPAVATNYGGDLAARERARFGGAVSSGRRRYVSPLDAISADRELSAQLARREFADAFAALDGVLAGHDVEAAQFEAEVDLLLALHGDVLANWVEKAGGLPSYIKRIATHLEKQPGFDKSRAIATAVNAAKRMCATGDTNWPGRQEVNPGSRAQACAAVAEWEAKRGAGKG